MMMALEKNENAIRRDEKTAAEKPAFAKKVVDAKNRPLAECLAELFRDIGISKIDESMMVTEQMRDRLIVSDNMASTLQEVEAQFEASKFNKPVAKATTHAVNVEPNLFSGTVTVPQTTRADDMYSSSFNHSRQAMMLRMEHLFDEVESKVMDYLAAGSDILALLTTSHDEVFEHKVRLPSKPVVIGELNLCWFGCV